MWRNRCVMWLVKWWFWRMCLLNLKLSCVCLMWWICSRLIWCLWFICMCLLILLIIMMCCFLLSGLFSNCGLMVCCRLWVFICNIGLMVLNLMILRIILIVCCIWFCICCVRIVLCVWLMCFWMCLWFMKRIRKCCVVLVMKVGVNGCVGWVMMCDVCCVVVLVFGWFDGGVVCWSGLCDEEVFVEFGEFEYFEDFV